MARPIYIIGHKNSDLDSVASAYAYARLLQLQGENQAVHISDCVIPDQYIADAYTTIPMSPVQKCAAASFFE